MTKYPKRQGVIVHLPQLLSCGKNVRDQIRTHDLRIGRPGNKIVFFDT